MKSKYFIIPLIFLQLILVSSSVAAKNKSPSGSIRILSTEKIKKPFSVPIKGNIEGSIQWVDPSGTNLFVFSKYEEGPHQMDSAWKSEVNAVHYRKSDTGYSTVRNLRDTSEAWGTETGVTSFFLFEGATLKLTDLDKDGHTEISFFYIKGPGGLDPDTLKYHIWIPNKFLIVTGKIPRHEDFYSSYSKVFDPVFDSVSDVFRIHASKTWDGFVQKNVEELQSIFSKPREFKMSNYDLLSAIKVRGYLVEHRSWVDKSGANTWLVSEQIEGQLGKREWKSNLHSASYKKGHHSYGKVWEIRDFSGDSLTHLAYVKNSFHVSDWDGDGLAEVGFFYRKGRDPSHHSDTLKYMLFTKGKKLAIRGVIPNRIFHLKESRKVVFDPAFDSVPELFRKQAARIWDEFTQNNLKAVKANY